MTVEATGSTNDDVRELAREGAEEGLWLRALRQTGGRGRQGRAWESPSGNLHASTLVRLRDGDPPAASLALVAAVALYEAVEAIVPGAEGLTLKWPNDLLLGGDKLAGILLERHEDVVVIGIGANLASHPELSDRPTTSLAAHGISCPPDLLLRDLAEGFDAWLGRWRSSGLAPVRKTWLAYGHGKGAALSVHDPAGALIEGTFAGLALDGALRLRLADGAERVIHAGDVFLV